MELCQRQTDCVSIFHCSSMSAESLACHINSCRATAPSQRAPGQHAFSTSTWQQSTGINKLKQFSLFFFISNSQMLIVPLFSYSSWSALHVGWEKVLYFLVHAWNIYYKMIWFLLFFHGNCFIFLVLNLFCTFELSTLNIVLEDLFYREISGMLFIYHTTVSWQGAFVNHFY